LLPPLLASELLEQPATVKATDAAAMATIVQRRFLLGFTVAVLPCPVRLKNRTGLDQCGPAWSTPQSEVKDDAESMHVFMATFAPMITHDNDPTTETGRFQEKCGPACHPP
jgi:hypothetical protein